MVEILVMQLSRENILQEWCKVPEGDDAAVELALWQDGFTSLEPKSRTMVFFETEKSSSWCSSIFPAEEDAITVLSRSSSQSSLIGVVEVDKLLAEWSWTLEELMTQPHAPSQEQLVFLSSDLSTALERNEK